ncbi:MAG: ATP-binding protein [Desulfobacterales bacterium]|nr:ATP-binding protein [Desulfobacterales bacterium]
MTDFQARILDTLCTKAFRDAGIAYFITDDQGGVLYWGGNLTGLKIPDPEKNTPVSDLLIFTEGLLPLPDDEMALSCITLPSGVCVDARLYRMEDTHELIIWDSSRKEAFLNGPLQASNELSLLIEEKKKILADLTGRDLENGQRDFLEKFFLALNFAVLEMDGRGEFLLFGSPPSWIDSLPQADRLREKKPLEEDHFSFLGNFIQEVKSRWERQNFTSYNSGLWIETDARGEECLFEATTLTAQGRHLLIISNDACLPGEKQSIIQKGRDLALHYESVKRSGRKLRDMNDILELRVKERTRELEEVNRQLSIELAERKKAEAARTEVLEQLRQSQKMEAIGTLAGGIAHDFNNILSGIIGYTELSMAEAGGGEKFQKILDAAYRARGLVSQILTFSHQKDQDREPVMLTRVVNEVLDLIKGALPVSVSVKSDLRSNAYILADPTQIHQVVMNLCTNAWQAMAERGGTVSVVLSESEIPDPEVPRLSPGRYLILAIQDTGPGIPREIIEKIFDPYFTTKEEGTGLGLSVVHGIVRKTGGAVTVDAKPSGGSVFTVYFPVWDLRDKRMSGMIG